MLMTVFQEHCFTVKRKDQAMAVYQIQWFLSCTPLSRRHNTRAWLGTQITEPCPCLRPVCFAVGCIICSDWFVCLTAKKQKVGGSKITPSDPFRVSCSLSPSVCLFSASFKAILIEGPGSGRRGKATVPCLLLYSRADPETLQ